METGAEINPKAVAYYQGTLACTKKLGHYTCLTKAGAWRNLKMMPGENLRFSDVRIGKKGPLLQFELEKPVTVNQHIVEIIEVALDKYSTLIDCDIDLSTKLILPIGAKAKPKASQVEQQAYTENELYGAFS